MRDGRFIVSFILLMIIQLPLAKNCQIGPYIYISLLPALTLCLPTGMRTSGVMAVAFACGLVVDMLADGVIGLNAAAVVPVAALQKTLIRKLIDEEIVNRGYSFSFYNNGYGKIGLALLVCCVVYFAVYVFLDSAGTRPLGFNLGKACASIAVSFVFGMVACGVLHPRQKR